MTEGVNDVSDGVTEGVTDGVTEDVADGGTVDVTDCVTDGVMEHVTDGVTVYARLYRDVLRGEHCQLSGNNMSERRNLQ